LGYEGKFSHHNNQDEPTQTNDDEALLSGIIGSFWPISVTVLHSCFIVVDVDVGANLLLLLHETEVLVGDAVVVEQERRYFQPQ
jgi:hypothetical protein